MGRAGNHRLEVSCVDAFEYGGGPDAMVHCPANHRVLAIGISRAGWGTLVVCEDVGWALDLATGVWASQEALVEVGA